MARITLLFLLCVAPALGDGSASCATDEVSCLIQVSPKLTTASSSMNDLPSFAAFIQEHGRDYQKGSDEYEMRQQLYNERVQNVQQHNSNPKRRWSAGVNHLSDRTEEELSQLRGLRIVQADSSTTSAGAPPGLVEVESDVLPDSKMWTALAAIQAESDQGSCGSCWAVATATTLWANAEAKGHPHQFSAQELVSCVPNPHKCGGDGGCKGSTVELALNWVMDKGLADIAETPYYGKDMKCKKEGGFSFLSNDGDHSGSTYDHAKLQEMIAVGFHGGQTAASTALSLAGWERLPENEYEPLKRAVAQIGPVAVSVGAGPWAAYSQGVFDGCGKDSVINHAVVLMGYGKGDLIFDGSEDKYWTIKNSWGSNWGEQGNIRLLREENSHGHCGTDNQPKEGTGCDDTPPSVKVCGMCGILYDAVVPHFHKRKGFHYVDPLNPWG